MADALGPFSFRREPCKTGLMGIVNVTPDSFHESSRRANVAEAIHSAQNMIKSGAEIIDIGGESTRPGSQPVSIEQELERVLPVISGLREIGSHVAISIDTRHYQVARTCLGCWSNHHQRCFWITMSSNDGVGIGSKGACLYHAYAWRTEDDATKSNVWRCCPRCCI